MRPARTGIENSQDNGQEIHSFFPKDIMRRRRATQDENELHWKGEDGQREDECKFNVSELAPKDVPRCLAEPPDIALRACR